MYWVFWQPFLPASLPSAVRKGSVAASSALPKVAVARPSFLEPAMFNAFGDQAVCVLNAEGGCAAVSPGWENVVGMIPEHALHQGFLQAVHPDFQPKITHRLAGSLQADAPGKKLRCQIKNATGVWQWFDLTVAHVEFDEELEQTLFTCVMRNVSEQVQAEKKLHKAKLETELALKGRSEFLANMSHELRTPLNAILGFAQIIESGIYGDINNPRYKEYMSHIQDSGYSLLDRINDLLEISLIETGRVCLMEEEVDMMQLMHNAMEIHTHHAFSSRVMLQEQFFKGHVIAHVDRIKMKQVVSNLISNALSYNKSGGAVTVRTEISKAGDFVITVADNGQGMSARQLKEIVSAMQSPDSFHARDINGIGIGLALVKEYVELHQGTIEIESKAGVGSTVRVTLPRERLITVITHKAEKPATKIAVKRTKKEEAHALHLT